MINENFEIEGNTNNLILDGSLFTKIGRINSLFLIIIRNNNYNCNIPYLKEEYINIRHYFLNKIINKENIFLNKKQNLDNELDHLYNKIFFYYRKELNTENESIENKYLLLIGQFELLILTYAFKLSITKKDNSYMHIPDGKIYNLIIKILDKNLDIEIEDKNIFKKINKIQNFIKHAYESCKGKDVNIISNWPKDGIKKFKSFEELKKTIIEVWNIFDKYEILFKNYSND